MLLAARGLGNEATISDDASRPDRSTEGDRPGSVVAFPSARGVKPPTGNLPFELSSFAGREREIAEVKGLLGSTRLLTLTGSGGSGKTRLALVVASDMTTVTTWSWVAGVLKG